MLQQRRARRRLLPRQKRRGRKGRLLPRQVGQRNALLHKGREGRSGRGAVLHRHEGGPVLRKRRQVLLRRHERKSREGLLRRNGHAVPSPRQRQVVRPSRKEERLRTSPGAVFFLRFRTDCTSSNLQAKHPHQFFFEVLDFLLASVFFPCAVVQRLFQQLQVLPQFHLSQRQAAQGPQRLFLVGVEFPRLPVNHAQR